MTPAPADALDAVLPQLCCPVCARPLHRTDRVVRCARGHCFDVARQGYLNLAVGHAGPGTGDSAEMVAARERVHAAGVLDEVVGAVVAAVAVAPDGLVLDLAGGTGVYLGAVLDQHPDQPGLCVDLSVPALRRAARSHPRMAAIGADAWGRLPLADGAVAAALSVFGPRDPVELARVVISGGMVVVAYPDEAHLNALRPALGLPAVGAAKPQRLAGSFAGFAPAGDVAVQRRVDVSREVAADLALMGPAGKRRTADDLRAAAAALEDVTAVTVSVRVQAWRRPPVY